MTDAELRAAAERLLKLHTGDGTDEELDGYCDEQAGIDGRLIVDAYLAEHPADDGDAVTEDWLRAVGGEYRPAWGAWVLPAGDQRITLSRSVMRPGEWTLQYETEFYWPLAVVTRGDLRRLLVCFGVPLPEPSDAPPPPADEGSS